MPYFDCENIRIAGVACAVPEQVIEVDSFKDEFGVETIEKFKKMTGVQRFHKTYQNQTASDLGFAAANHLIRELDLERNSIKALVFVSHSPDYRRPATAGILQKRLGLQKDCACLDINLGCSAYPYGVFTLASMMSCANIKRALLICAESVTKVSSPHDRSTAMLFGDCGSASLLTKDDNVTKGIRGSVRTDGQNFRAIIVPGGGFRNLEASKEITLWPDGNRRHLHNLYMDGGAVFNFTITEVPNMIQDFLGHIQSSVNDYDSFVLHQANLFILKQIARKIKIPLDKVPVSIDQYGNTSGAAIPLTLCNSLGDKQENSFKRVMMCGFGVGLSLGVIDATILPSELLPVITTTETFSEGMINSPDDLEL